jgi:hypothetical protein
VALGGRATPKPGMSKYARQEALTVPFETVACLEP